MFTFQNEICKYVKIEEANETNVPRAFTKQKKRVKLERMYTCFCHFFLRHIYIASNILFVNGLNKLANMFIYARF